ncbi:MAG TPA: ribosome biogenesis GTP-binding protein YihA/YsxC [Longimicrobiaceae bacterium]|jgi:GTP-binding protein|nr:ribosome biogenesis GTP-binding protein YihA/YsxC [Longimicrobiaceae bacterium]
MKIKSSEFLGAIGQVGQAAPESARALPQVAFSGRSNVGKSSLINRLLGRTRSPIARVSQQPGKTQEINFYRVRSDRGDFCLVDFPGYGYAKVPKALRERWRPLIDSYLHGTEVLAGVVQLIDLRHGPTADDLVAIEQLAAAEIPVLFALTKADKLKPRQREQAIRDVAGRLGAELDQVIAVSSFSGEGRDALLETLGALLEQDSAVGIQDSGSPTED